MTAQLFHPRALVHVRAIVSGEEFDTDAEPHHVTVVRKSHRHASEAEIVIEHSALPFDLRHLEGLSAVVFLGDAGRADGDVRRDSAARFVGDIDDEEVHHGEGSTISLKLRDLSQPAREHKALKPAELPRYSDTLEQAIRRLIAAVPGWSDQIALRPTTELQETILASLTSARGRSGYLPMPNNDPSAWEAIETACALSGLLVSMDLRDLVVRAPRSAYGDPGEPEGDRPAAAFVFGTEEANLLEVEEHKRFLRHRKGVEVVSYDPATRSAIKAQWPPDALLPPRRKPRPIQAGSRVTRTRRKPAPPPPPPSRDVFAVSGIHTQTAAENVAKRIWAERGAQEIDGTLRCPVWSDEHLALTNGSRITVRVKPDLEAEIRRRGNDERAAVDFLRQRLLVSEAAARLLVRASRTQQSHLFYADTVSLQYSAESDPMIEIRYLNLIVV